MHSLTNTHRNTPRSHRSKIKSPQTLKKTLNTLSMNGGRIVFTNGCFDLLHQGHVTYLEKARKLGTILIVALNTDASVRKLKGPTRPLNTLRARAAVMAALECVDYVTWFSDDTPAALIRMLRPKILVKGGDYSPKQIAGATDVLSWGGKVKIIPFLKGHSTTQLINKQRNN